MSATLKPRTTTVLLFQGDDLDPLIEKAEAVEKAIRTAGPARLGDAEVVGASEAAEFDEYANGAAERAVKVTLTALGRRAYRDLRNSHPPRMVNTPEGEMPHPQDVAKGFNIETFGDDLVPACMGEEFGALEDRVAFLDTLSDGDWSKLYSAAVNLNQSPGPDPKVRLSSHFAPTSDETSSSPARLA